MADKHSAIIFNRLNIAAENCLKIIIEFGALFKEEVGDFALLKDITSI